MTSMYDGVDARVPLRCLGCADGIVVRTHRCAGDRELQPTGGYCQCPRPGCGPSASGTLPQARTVQGRGTR